VPSEQTLHLVRRVPDDKVKGLVHAYIGRKRIRLGRRYAVDDRDKNYLAKRPRKPRGLPLGAVTYRNWNDTTWRGDQGNTAQCVAYSAVHRIENSPKTYTAAGPVVAPATVYNAARAIDEWPGTDYEGTSVRAGAKVMLAKGFIKEYRWVPDMATFIDLVHYTGPVIVGSIWWWSMFTPRWVKDAQGTYRWTLVIDESDGDAGGHAWLVNGVNRVSKTFRMLNSWGSSWGLNGHAWVSFDTMEQLVFGQWGEACLYVET
jgi:hypothetical protein